MTERPLDRLEIQLHAAGQAFAYPPTPDIARGVSERLRHETATRRAALTPRRLAFSIAIGLVLIVLFGALAVPQVRAQILEFLQIGVIRILLVEPTATPTPLPAPPTSSTGLSGQELALTPTPTLHPTSTALPSLLALSGEIDLDRAQRRVDFSIRLPTYPAELGRPDHAFLQDLEGQVLVMVWLNPQQPGEIQLSLHQYTGEGNLTGAKVEPVTIETTTVDGRPAVWATGPYLLQLNNGDYDLVRMIEGHVLIWAEGRVTYRLETELSLAEAVRIAESLRPLSEFPDH